MPATVRGFLAGVGVEWRAGADEVAVAFGAVDAPDGGPDLGAGGAGGVGGFFAGVGVVPLSGDGGGGVGGIDERVVVGGPDGFCDAVDLSLDGDHGVAEAIQLGEVFAFGGLDHEGAGDRERHRGRVQAVVGEPLGDVVDGDAGRLGDRAQVEDALV